MVGCQISPRRFATNASHVPRTRRTVAACGGVKREVRLITSFPTTNQQAFCLRWEEFDVLLGCRMQNSGVTVTWSAFVLTACVVSGLVLPAVADSRAGLPAEKAAADEWIEQNEGR